MPSFGKHLRCLLADPCRHDILVPNEFSCGGEVQLNKKQWSAKMDRCFCRLIPGFLFWLYKILVFTKISMVVIIGWEKVVKCGQNDHIFPHPTIPNKSPFLPFFSQFLRFGYKNILTSMLILLILRGCDVTLSPCIIPKVI